jgi:hypothetical protein
MGPPKRMTPTCEGARRASSCDKTSFVPSPYSRKHTLTKFDGGLPLAKANRGNG